MNFEAVAPNLHSRLEGPTERVGFIMRDLEIVEVENICDDKENGFEVSGADLLTALQFPTIATWHTHPGATSELSANDLLGFRDYPDWLHIIAGTDGVTLYRVLEGAVIREAFWNAG